VRLVLKDGKIYRGNGEQHQRLNEIWTQTPAHVTSVNFRWASIRIFLSPMCDILFDEKIAARCTSRRARLYEDCGNGNKVRSIGTWFLIQRKDWGGGEVWFDGELIRKDGIFSAEGFETAEPGEPKVILDLRLPI